MKYYGGFTCFELDQKHVERKSGETRKNEIFVIAQAFGNWWMRKRLPFNWFTFIEINTRFYY